MPQRVISVDERAPRSMPNIANPNPITSSTATVMTMIRTVLKKSVHQRSEVRTAV